MFKKSLIALALAGTAVAGAANAASISATNINVSKEGNLANGNSIITQADVADIAINVGVDYIVNDIVEFTVSGAVFNTAVTPVITNDNVSTNGATLVFVDYSSANTARFRVSTADVGAADGLTLSTYTLDLTGLASGTEVKMSSQAISVNPLIGAYDKATATDVALVREQTKNTFTTSLNGQVSTGNGRAEFTTQGGSKSEDVLTVTLTDNEADVDGLSFNKITHTIKGSSFSWLMDYDLAANGGDADGVLEAAEIATGVVYSSTNVGGQDTIAYTLDTAMTTLTAVQTADAGSDIDLVNTFTFKNIGNAAGGTVITAPQSFTYSSVATDGTTSVTEAAASAGSFTLDGSSTDIAFLPFGADYAQSITVTNNGAVVGAITVTLTSGGMAYSKELVATSTAKAVTDISAEVAAFAAASGVTGNASLNVTTNSPGIDVKGLYYHKPTQDRVLVGEKTSN